MDKNMELLKYSTSLTVVQSESSDGLMDDTNGVI